MWLFCEQLAADAATATWRDVAGQLAPWDIHAGLLARATSALELANWQRAQINRDPKTRPSPPPEPVRPPSSPDGGPAPVVREQGISSAALLDFKRRTSGKAVA